MGSHFNYSNVSADPNLEEEYMEDEFEDEQNDSVWPKDDAAPDPFAESDSDQSSVAGDDLTTALIVPPDEADYDSPASDNEDFLEEAAKQDSPRADMSMESSFGARISDLGEPRWVPRPDARRPKDSAAVLRRFAAGEEIFRCELCGKGYCRRNDMLTHLIKKHYEDEETFPCEQCDKVYGTRSQLTYHSLNGQCWRKWDRTPNYPTPPTHNPPHDQGPLMDMGDLTPSELFLEFFGPVLPYWIPNTNRKGYMKYPAERQHPHKHAAWTELTVPESLQFIKLLLAWGCAGRWKHHRDPWRTDTLWHNDFFAETMSGNRWNYIKKATCFADSALEQKSGNRGCKTSDCYSPLWRVEDAIGAVAVASQDRYYPQRSISVDEMMIKHRGKCKNLHSLPRKPIRRGLKLTVASDAGSGYVLNFIPCFGQVFPMDEDLGKLGGCVVATIRSDNLPQHTRRSYLGFGHFIFTDNLYSSFLLLEWLMRTHTYFCGTFRNKRRRVPPILTDPSSVDATPLMKGQSRFIRSNTNVQLCSWFDNNHVLVGSTLPNVTSLMGWATRKKFNKRKKIYYGKEVVCAPAVTLLYNAKMAGVDLTNQYISYLHIAHKTPSWVTALFFQVVDICLLNAFVIFKFYHPKCAKGKGSNWSFREFRVMVVKSLDAQLKISIGDINYYPIDKGIAARSHASSLPSRAREQRTEVREISRLSKEQRKSLGQLKENRRYFHDRVKIVGQHACAYCSRSSRPHRVRDGCRVCKVALGDGVCFRNFHSELFKIL